MRLIKMRKSTEENERVKRFKEALRRSGIKLTPQRLEVFKEVTRSKEHPDAVAIYKAVHRRIPSISLDTVYRTLWLLLDLGLIATLGSQRERIRFNGNMSPHHHFICKRCGRTHDLFGQEFKPLKIPEAVRALGSVDKVQVEVIGLCLECSKQKEKTP
jgi:Fur family peroxide stress response transcriptional regulator